MIKGKKKKILHNPAVGEILLSEFLEPAQLTPAKLASLIFMPLRLINQVIKGKRLMSADLDLRLCKFFSLSEGYFMRLQDAHAMMQAKRALNKEFDRIIPFQQLLAKGQLYAH